MSHYITDTTCPCCGKAMLYSYDQGVGRGYYYACPECGAKFDELPESEDE